MKTYPKSLKFCPPPPIQYDYVKTNGQETRPQSNRRAHCRTGGWRRATQGCKAVRPSGQEGQGPQEARQISQIMSPAERLAVIRAKARNRGLGVAPVPTGIHRATNPELPARPKHPYSPPNITPSGPRYTLFGKIVNPAPAFDWVKTPDPKPEKPCRIKRTLKVSPLTVIAKKWEDPETFRPRV